MVTWLFWAIAALAQPAPVDVPNAAALCADAAVGTEVEVCMALAARHPDQVDAVAAALRSHVDRATSGDRELLDGLLMLMSPNQAEEGAARLGELHDPRAIAPLAQAVEQRELAVALAAVTALGGYRDALEPLTRWITDKQLPVEVRVAAARSLGVLRSEEGADALITALRRRGMPPVLREAMLDVVTASFPERLAELEHQVTRDGAWWIAAGSGEALGYSLALGGRLGRARLAGLGGVTGFAAGGTAGYILGRAWPMEAEDAAFLTTTGVMSGAAGVLIGAGLTQTDDGAWLAGLGGHVVGYGLGFALRRVHGGTVGDSVEAAGLSGATAMAVGTATNFAIGGARGDDAIANLPALATGIGFGAGLLAGHLLAPRVDLEPRDGWLLALGAGYGFTAGVLLPVRPPRRGLPFTGLALGGVTAYVLADRLDVPFTTVSAGTVGMAFGGTIGAGIGWLAQPLPPEGAPALRAGALLGGTLGLAMGLYAEIRNPQPIDDRDVVLAAVGTGWTTWQAIGWHEWLDPPPDFDGAFLMAPAVVGAAAALASPLLDVPNGTSAGALSIGLWGAYLGGVTADLADVRRPDILLATLVGSDAGLLVGTLLAVPPISVPPVVIALADAGGVLGGATFALVTSFVDDDVDTILASSFVGSALGFVGGAIGGVALNRYGRSRELALAVPGVRPPGRWALVPGPIAGTRSVAFGASLQVTEW